MFLSVHIVFAYLSVLVYFFYLDLSSSDLNWIELCQIRLKNTDRKIHTEYNGKRRSKLVLIYRTILDHSSSFFLKHFTVSSKVKFVLLWWLLDFWPRTSKVYGSHLELVNCYGMSVTDDHKHVCQSKNPFLLPLFLTYHQINNTSNREVPLVVRQELLTLPEYRR